MALTLLRTRQALVLSQTTPTSGNNRLRRYRPRLRQADRLTALHAAQQKSGFEASVRAERRRFYFSA